MAEQVYRYRRQDFGPLPVRLEHLDIHLNFIDERVEGTNTLKLSAINAMQSLRLDVRDLEVRKVEWLDQQDHSVPLAFEVKPESNALVIRLPEPVEPGTAFRVRTHTVCIPGDTILEGIYRDTTPPGCPPQYMSQFQQWGFPRVLPVIDDCRAKCTMTTTLEASSRYTHLISNGDVCRRRNPSGRPEPKPGDPSRQVITYVNPIPMAPYLFIACVGTWDMLEDEFVYPSGRRVRLEYLVPPGRLEGARIPMAILKDSVGWQGRTQEYEYTREVYRTICMERSNFGGMENVGNTTIVTDAALVDAATSDSRLLYAHAVIVHEFEHNQCGSDVTMETPFDMWLNEAFTVDVERAFMQDRFDPDSRRLDEIASIRAPIGGPLAVEDAGHQGYIVRSGFNDPDELVDGVTYVKAAEVIRMLRAILGEETFRAAKNRYFEQYRGGNANTDEFFHCFETVSGRDLTQFKREWLYTIGYPKVTATYRYDAPARTLTLILDQERSGKGGRFHVPVDMALLDGQGKELPGSRQTLELTSARLECAFRDVPPDHLVSLNRGFSFYGTFADRSATRKDLVRQIRQDTDGVNRVEAMRRLTDLERVRLVLDSNARIDPEWLEVFGSVIRDGSIPVGLKAALLSIEEQSMDRTYLAWYRERHRARMQLMDAVAAKWKDDLRHAFDAVDTYRPSVSPRDGIDERRLKGVLLRLLIQADSPDVHALAESHYRRAWNLTDRMNALQCLYISRHPGRMALMDQAFDKAKDHLSAYTSYLSIVGTGAREEVFDRLALEQARPVFQLAHPTHNRALLMSLAANNALLWTDRGIAWMQETVLALANANERSAYQLVGAFQLVARLADDLKPRVIKALQTMRNGVDRSRHVSLAGRIDAFLASVEAIR
ncbi:MAG: peptidase M1 [Lentisphaerae bacterium RIFOXYC12_FULL_60_16]|nr:MAG: peptidase M1 [Lentisphaerae bacterium RIFOXYC12_FULL_60_16]